MNILFETKKDVFSKNIFAYIIVKDDNKIKHLYEKKFSFKDFSNETQLKKELKLWSDSIIQQKNSFSI